MTVPLPRTSGDLAPSFRVGLLAARLVACTCIKADRTVYCGDVVKVYADIFTHSPACAVRAAFWRAHDEVCLPPEESES